MLRFIEETHQYFDGETELPSVTKITRFLSVDVAENARSWMRDAAADRGRRVHQYCADIDYGIEPDEIDWDCAGYVQAFRAFKRDYGIKEWLAIEMPLGSAEIGFAGTLDRLCVLDGKITIIDWKTGGTINKAQLTAQLTGYAELAPLMGYVPEVLMGVQLRKDGKYTRPYICQYDIELFNACRLLHERLGK